MYYFSIDFYVFCFLDRGARRGGGEQGGWCFSSTFFLCVCVGEGEDRK